MPQSFQREKIKEKKKSTSWSKLNKLSSWIRFWKSIMFNKLSEQVKIEKKVPTEIQFNRNGQQSWISVIIKDWNEEKELNLNIPIWGDK